MLQSWLAANSLALVPQIASTSATYIVNISSFERYYSSV